MVHGKRSRTSTRASRVSGLLFGILFLCTLCASAAFATWDADFFTYDTGGQAIIEEMAIAPAAVYSDGVTYIAFQGVDLDPYAISYDHVTKRWDGPYKIADNPLAENRDMHGAPSIAIDGSGYLHVFFGAHNGYVRHRISPAPGRIEPDLKLNSSGELVYDLWKSGPTLAGNFTYPQPYMLGDSTVKLTVRKDNYKAATPWLSGWRVYQVDKSPYASFETSWTPIVRDSQNRRWYISTADTDSGELDVAMVALTDLSPDPYARQDVYYLKVGLDGRLRTAAGVEITATVEPDWDNTIVYDPALYGPWEGDLQDAGAEVLEASWSGSLDPPDRNQNQVVVEHDPSGDPAVLFLSGQGDVFRWTFSRWDSVGQEWVTDVICETDQFFDAGTFEFKDEDHISAYLTTGGGVEPITVTTNRGGSVIRYDSSDGGATWQQGAVIKEAQPLYGERYNDPQIVHGTPSGEGEVLFCEWDNAGVNFVHKVFLSDEDGNLVQKEVTPQFTRIAGLDRIGTSISVAKRTFPLGANWVVLANAKNFPDALAGVPLAYAYDAPILLVGDQGITAELAAELQALRISGRTTSDTGVLILGGQSAISDDVAEEVARVLYEAPVNVKSDGSHEYTLAKFQAKITRLGGANRYDTAVRIAQQLQTRRGYTSSTCVVTSGESFADALTISPVAAVNGWPILLTESAKMTPQTVDYANSGQYTMSYIVGGTSVVATSAESYLPGTDYPEARRLAGSNRFATSYVVAGFGANHGLRRERLTIASGETFPDALSGGVLAARSRGPMLITPSRLGEDGNLESGISILLATSSNKALDWYLLGGESAVSPDVAGRIASYLAP